MGDYYSDDLESLHSEDEGFSEDLLTNDEYDQLYDVLPKLQHQLQGYNHKIDAYHLKECLYNNYFDLNDSLAEIKSRFPKLKRTYILHLVLSTILFHSMFRTRLTTLTWSISSSLTLEGSRTFLGLSF